MWNNFLSYIFLSNFKRYDIVNKNVSIIKKGRAAIRILITNHFPLIGSGSGVYVANIAKKLINLGHKVCIIAPENTIEGSTLDGVKTHPVFFKYEEKIEGQLPFNFPCFDPHPRSGESFYNFTDEQINLYMEAFDKAIKEEIEKFKPDIIHAQHIWLISNVVSKYDIPFIVTAHGSDLMGYNATDRFHKYCYPVIEKCKRIITISKENNEEVIKAYPKAKGKTTIIENGYDKNMFYYKKYNKKHVLKELNINKKYKKIVAFAGRLAHNKGVDVLLKAVKEYENEDVLTLIAGGGTVYDELYELSKKLDLKNVAFLGNQTHDSLRKIYNIADVLAVPSREEAFGLVAIEALACGLPVIATNSGGMKNFVNKEVGFLIDIDDSEMLAENVKKVLNKEVKFKRKKIAKYARTNYSQENFMKNLVDIYINSI